MTPYGTFFGPPQTAAPSQPSLPNGAPGTSAAGYNASATGMTNPTGQPNVFDTAAGQYNTGVNNTNFAASAGAVPATMNQYLNPYQDQVIGDTLSRIRDRQMQDLNMVRGQAHQASAYGGARHGLVEAELMDRYNRNMYESAGQMAHQGFNTAAGFGQSRIAQILGAAGQQGQQAQQGMQFGQQALGMQQQAGQQQRDFLQGLLDQATGQYDAYINYPQTALGTALAGVQGNPLAGNQTRTETYKPGTLDYLSLGAGLGSSYLGGK